jgi:broad specificity phosphatase PhoE
VHDGWFAGPIPLNQRFEQPREESDDALLIVTHGLTMRLILMRYFNWSVDTFATVYNPSNCNTWVLKKREVRGDDADATFALGWRRWLASYSAVVVTPSASQR